MRSRMVFFIGGIVGLCLSLPAIAVAQDGACTPKSYPELVKCAVETSTSIELSNKQLESSRHLEDVAGQLINPELSGDSVHKAEKSETTASLLFTLELGGKRSARRSEARAEAEKTALSTGLSKQQTKLELILKLYRLSHLKSELHIEEESGSTFSKIVKQYQQRAALNPEQTISLSVFKMAIADHQLRSTRLKSEQEELTQELIASTKLNRDQILLNLPERKAAWPTVQDSGDIDRSPHSKIASAELTSALSASEKAKSDSWPDIKLGPALKIQRDEGLQDTYWGLSASIPLPLFSLNGPGRALGAARVSEAEVNYQNARLQAGARRARLLQAYRESVAGLERSISVKEVAQEHGKVETFFFKGLVPSSLVIEAHRQLFELEERRNETERFAIEALGSLYIIDNTFSEVIL